jgi:hypothetical protein
VRRRPPSKGSGGGVEQVRRPESKQDRLARTAGQAFVAEMPDREGERRFVDEENRQIAGATIAVAILALRSSSLHVRARESAILDFTCPSIAIFKGRPLRSEAVSALILRDFRALLQPGKTAFQVSTRTMRRASSSCGRRLLTIKGNWRIFAR